MDKDKSNNKNVSRRDVLKGLATVPVLGAFGYGAYKKWNSERLRRSSISNELGLNFGDDTLPDKPERSTDGTTIRVGIIGYGIRGKQLLRAAGFAHPSVIDEWITSAEKNSGDRRYADYLAQDDLNIEITAVCDLFDVFADEALMAASNINRLGSDGKMKSTAKRYRRYTDLLNADNVDAVIIATPDHWHAQMVIDAAKAQKHV